MRSPNRPGRADRARLAGGRGKPSNYHTGDAQLGLGLGARAAPRAGDAGVRRSGGRPPSGRQFVHRRRRHVSGRDRGRREPAPARRRRRGRRLAVPRDGHRKRRPRPGALSVAEPARGRRYEFEGTSCQAGLDEPEHHNAIHGLVRWLGWTRGGFVGDGSGSGARLCRNRPTDGGSPSSSPTPSLQGELRRHGADRSISRGAPAPFGLGFHPYLDAGPGGVDGCTLLVPAGTSPRATSVDFRSLRGRSPERAYDFRGSAPLEGVKLDDCFTGLSRPAPEHRRSAAWQVLLVLETAASRACGRRTASAT